VWPKLNVAIMHYNFFLYTEITKELVWMKMLLVLSSPFFKEWSEKHAQNYQNIGHGFN
jgi:hypothetical protein